ncbi:hypothetical protein [Alienimonas californiensis]|uniref:Uncharacterized protein n=1 Tax=Alienimonas californiensis TaxID=2527989 RepID=A0A517P9G0_9PLAN|nr:hypothetical protein [Alienimonas californiensis]QDT16017.1 hypothetical protein CA12_21150 [Alienimonas californiensis]
MATPKQRRNEHLARNARSAPRKRLIGALTGGPLGLLAPIVAVLVWAALDGGWEEHGLQPEGGTGALVTGLLMLAIGVGFPVGLLGAMLARRLRTSRGASWGDAATAFVGAYLAGALAAAVVGLLFVA